MTPIDLGLVVLAVPALLGAGHLFLLTCLSVRPRAGRSSCGRRFVVLVPAHDEAGGIGATLADLARQDYPPDRWRIVVIADNCSDATAAIARDAGAGVIERRDPGARGKGHALRAAIDMLLQRPGSDWDSLVVIDADTRVDPELLARCSARLERGEAALQVAYLPRAGAGGPAETMRRIALTAFHVVRSRGRERLGWSAGLRGNGMVFSRACLAAHPHTATSRTEDVEFGLQLGRAGVRREDIAAWIMHPGGREVLLALQEKLGLVPG